MSNTTSPRDGLPNDFLFVVISRREVETGDISVVLRALQTLMQTPTVASTHFERVEVGFHGYDDVTDELSERPNVRNFVERLDDQFPYWLFFLSKQHCGLQKLSLCFLPPNLTPEARTRIFPQRVGALLERRWFPAMNQMCEYVGHSERQIEQLTDRVVTYVTHGPLRPGG